MFYLMKSVPQVMEACLVLIKHLVRNQSNFLYFLDRDILSYLNQCLISPNLFDLRRQALLLAEVVSNLVHFFSTGNTFCFTH